MMLVTLLLYMQADRWVMTILASLQLLLSINRKQTERDRDRDRNKTEKGRQSKATRAQR